MVITWIPWPGRLHRLFSSKQGRHFYAVTPCCPEEALKSQQVSPETPPENVYWRQESTEYSHILPNIWSYFQTSGGLLAVPLLHHRTATSFSDIWLYERETIHTSSFRFSPTCDTGQSSHDLRIKAGVCPAAFQHVGESGFLKTVRSVRSLKWKWHVIFFLCGSVMSNRSEQPS